MKVQRFIPILMVSILLMALSACGGGAAPEAVNEDTSAPAVEESATEEPAVEEAVEEPAAEEVATEEPVEEEMATAEPATEEAAEEAAEEFMAENAAGEAIELLFPDFDPANFTNSTTIDNAWSPLLPGMQWVYEGESLDGEEMVPHRIEFTVTDLTKEIAGVRVVVTWVVDVINGEEIVESELSFYAQDDAGSVWYLGEYPEEYDGGEFIDAPAWISGIEEARPGVKMVKEPQMDMPVYFQGWAPAVEWSDFGIVASIEDEVCVPVDCYADVLVIDESSLGEVGAFQQKLYAKGVGNIKVEWTGEDATHETLELVGFAQLEAEAMTEINAAAMEQEARAYERSPDVYGQTVAME